MINNLDLDDDDETVCLPLQSVCILLLRVALLNNSWEYNCVYQHCVN